MWVQLAPSSITVTVMPLVGSRRPSSVVIRHCSSLIVLPLISKVSGGVVESRRLTQRGSGDCKGMDHLCVEGLWRGLRRCLCSGCAGGWAGSQRRGRLDDRYMAVDLKFQVVDELVTPSVGEQFHGFVVHLGPTLA